MNAIPAGIEASLLDAGFSVTEVLILRRLLEDDALTLRELAARTGKSTGVLDQATKKLLRKNIIQKQTINDTAKFTLTSLNTVLHWMEDDLKRKHDVLSRQHQNFEQFIESFEHDKKRPGMEFFDGIDGIAQAYRKLLEHGKEILAYVPVFCSIEDDPLRDFKVEWFRQRRNKGIFMRVLTHNTPLGRRYQSRDPFEYRESILIDEEAYPFTFEKLVCGPAVLCINYAEKRACLLKYPELASMERTLFDSVWRQVSKKPEPTLAPSSTNASTVVPPTPIPLRIRALSGLREFFLSRTSIAAFCSIALLSALLTVFLYSYTEHLEFQRMQETVKSIAVTGAFNFDPKDLDALQVEQDWKKPEWGKVVNELKKIRLSNDDIEYVYLVRKTKNAPTNAEFISDSHSMNPFANTDSDPSNDVDANNDGKIEPQGADLLQWPGQHYPDPPKELFLAYEGPVANSQMYEDTWGKVLTGYAPIKDPSGRVAGVLAVDLRAKTLDKNVGSVFEPLLYFFCLFIFFVIIRLAAFNRRLFRELWKALRMRKVLIVITLCAEIAFFVTLGLYEYILHQTINEVGNKLMSIVATAAPDFDTRDLDKLHLARDMKTDAYQRVFRKLNEIKDANPEITYIYILRSVDKNHLYEWVADSYSNYNLPSIGPDVNGDGVLDQADEDVAPGIRYWIDDISEILEAQSHPAFEKQFDTDQWGTGMAADAPIKDSVGQTHATLGADVDVTDIYRSLNSKFLPLLWFAAVFSIAIFLCLVKKFC